MIVATTLDGRTKCSGNSILSGRFFVAIDHAHIRTGVSEIALKSICNNQAMIDYINTAEQIKQRYALADAIRVRGIKDAEVIQSIRNVPRHLFLPADMQDKAYVDKAFPIGHGQTISQPYTVAYQTELLAVKPGHKIVTKKTCSLVICAIIPNFILLY